MSAQELLHPNQDVLVKFGREWLHNWKKVLNGRTLAQMNPHPRDAHISFEKEGHRYTITINGKVIHPTSMTTLIGKYAHVFDADKVILSMMKGRKWKEGNSPHLGTAIDLLSRLWMMQTQVTQVAIYQQRSSFNGPLNVPFEDLEDENNNIPLPPSVKLSESDQAFFRGILLESGFTSSPLFKPVSDGIKDAWSESGKQAADKGTETHEMIEDFFNGIMEEIPLIKDFLLFLEWWMEFTQKHPQFNPFRVEWLIYDENAEVSGSIDFCLIGPDGQIIIVDWKRSREIKFGDDFGKKELPPLEHLDDCNYVHYALQQNGYERLLRTKYEKQVIGLYLMICHPNQEHYQMIEIPDMSYEMNLIWPRPLPSPSSTP